MSVGSNFMFHMVIREEINGCVSCGRFAAYVDFKVTLLSDYEKVKETCTSIAFICGVEFYVCMYLVYTRIFVDAFGACSFGVVYD
jgi:hypothetical protein